MLTREIQYVDLAEICVYSFLHYHPNTIFTLHCDEKTIDHAILKFDKEIDKGRVNLQVLDCESGANWQEQKLELILRMSGTKEIFLDADLRWNGAFSSESDGVLFFVKEFELRKKSPFREMLTQFHFAPPDTSMKNVSIFSFNGYELREADSALIRDTMEQYRDLVASTIVGKLDRPAIGRVIEQFTLSVCSETWDTEVSFVKEVDKPLDGRIVESCYFGATGGTF